MRVIPSHFATWVARLHKHPQNNKKRQINNKQNKNVQPGSDWSKQKLSVVYFYMFSVYFLYPTINSRLTFLSYRLHQTSSLSASLRTLALLVFFGHLSAPCPTLPLTECRTSCSPHFLKNHGPRYIQSVSVFSLPVLSVEYLQTRLSKNWRPRANA